MRTSLQITFLLLSCCLTSRCVRASNVYVWMIYGNGVTSRVQNLIEANADSLLVKLKLVEPPNFDIYAPGQIINTTGTRRRDLAEADETFQATHQGDHSGGIEAAVSRELQMTSCPNSCTKSGSNYCRSMGCAYCGKCRRRYLRGDLSRGDLSLTSVIEFTLNTALSLFCIGTPGCKLWSDILIVNANGTLTPAP